MPDRWSRTLFLSPCWRSPPERRWRSSVLAILAISCRIVLLHVTTRSHSRALPSLYWLIPIRDLLSFAIFVWSFCGRNVDVAGSELPVLRANGRCCAPIEGPKSVMMRTLLPAGSILRRLRRRRRLALPGEARDRLLLVSDLARPTRGPRRRLEADRRPAPRIRPRRRWWNRRATTISSSFTPRRRPSKAM